jgi:hypothetical protein
LLEAVHLAGFRGAGEGEDSVSDLQRDIARVAVGALVDSLAQVEADRANVRYLTVEVELLRGKPIEARAWIERRANVSKLLGVGRG